MGYDMGPPPLPFDRNKDSPDPPESSKKPATPIVWTPENSFDPPFPPVEESPWYKERAAKAEAAKIKAAKRQTARDEVIREQVAKRQAAKRQAAREEADREQAAKEEAAKK